MGKNLLTELFNFSLYSELAAKLNLRTKSTAENCWLCKNINTHVVSRLQNGTLVVFWHYNEHRKFVFQASIEAVVIRHLEAIFSRYFINGVVSQFGSH